MATVYLARDIKHDRHVALKVLSPELGAILGAERFLSEIRVTATLQHPNLLPLFDSGEADGLLFYVMPFVDGESLRQRLDRERQLPVDEAVRLAVSICSALDYAHRHGVIHRDLKPENILLHDGQPLVADFGIALAVSNAGGARVTATGLSLGTPQYMSPEQATGDRTLDARTDVYSLGAITFEMLVGDPPHVASTAQAIIAKVLTERPPNARTIRASVPEDMAYAIERALEKLPADRPATARDMADALQGRGAPSPRHAIDRQATSRATRTLVGSWPGLVVAAAALTFAAWRGFAGRDANSRDEPIIATLTPPPGVTIPADGALFSLSPNGRVFAMSTTARDGQQGIVLQNLDGSPERLLEGTRAAAGLFWSPASDAIGFFAQGALRVIDIASGNVRSLCAAPDAGGGTWNRDGVILFSPDFKRPLRRVPAGGGACEEVRNRPDVASTVGIYVPQFLADGHHFVAVAGTAAWLGDLGRDTIIRLGDFGADAPMVAFPDWLLIAGGGRGAKGLFAQRIDVRAGRLVGAPRRILPRPLTPFGRTAISASATGVLVEQSVPLNKRVAVRVVSAAGIVVDSITLHDVDEWTERLSHDGHHLALGGWGLWILDLTRRVTTQPLTAADSGLSTYTAPVWSPGDTLLAFAHEDTWAPFQVRTLDVRSGAERPLFDTPFANRSFHPTDWSSDGRYLAFTLDAGGDASHAEAWVRDLRAERSRKLFESTDSVDNVVFSPNMHWIAYEAAEHGKLAVYLRPFPGPGSAVRLSNGEGAHPRWRADGRSILFLAPGRVVMSVGVIDDRVDGLSLATAQRVVALPAGESFEALVDGQRFIVASSEGTLPPMSLVIGWPRLAEPRAIKP